MKGGQINMNGLKEIIEENKKADANAHGKITTGDGVTIEPGASHYVIKLTYKNKSTLITDTVLREIVAQDEHVFDINRRILDFLLHRRA